MSDTIVPPSFDVFFKQMTKPLIKAFFLSIERRLEVDWEGTDIDSLPSVITAAFSKLGHPESWSTCCVNMTDIHTVIVSCQKCADELLKQITLDGSKLNEIRDQIGEPVPWDLEKMVMWVFLYRKDLWEYYLQRAYNQVAAKSGKSYYYKPKDQVPDFAKSQKVFETLFCDCMKKSRGKPIEARIDKNEVGNYDRYIVYNDPYPRHEPKLKKRKVEPQMVTGAERFSIVHFPNQRMIRIVSEYLNDDQRESAAEIFIRAILCAERCPKPQERFDLTPFSSATRPNLHSDNERLIGAEIAEVRHAIELKSGSRKLEATFKSKDGDVYDSIAEVFPEYGRLKARIRTSRVVLKMQIHSGPRPAVVRDMFGVETYIHPWPTRTYNVSFTNRKSDCNANNPDDMEVVYSVCNDFGLRNIAGQAALK